MQSQQLLDLEEHLTEKPPHQVMEVSENSEYLQILKDKEESEKIARPDLDLFV